MPATLTPDQEFSLATALQVAVVVPEVHFDEPCYGLMERNGMVNLHKEKRVMLARLQIILVVRGDTIAAFKRILGPASDFPNRGPLAIMSPFGLETVGQCVDEAERSRDDTFERELRKEVAGTSTLIQDAIKEAEENRARIANRSVMGPSHRVQRNDFPHQLRRTRI